VSVARTPRESPSIGQVESERGVIGSEVEEADPESVEAFCDDRDVAVVVEEAPFPNKRIQCSDRSGRDSARDVLTACARGEYAKNEGDLPQRFLSVF